jgi:Sec-independent protein secretion pathway component TatC
MKRFSQLKLTKGLLVLFTLGVTLALYSVLPYYYDRTFQVQAQLQQQPDPNWIN